MSKHGFVFPCPATLESPRNLSGFVVRNIGKESRTPALFTKTDLAVMIGR